MQVLIVEDDLFAAKMLVGLLRESDLEAQVTIAASLKESRKSIRENLYDLIFLDVHLQDGLGTDIINELPSDQKIIFITGDPNYAIEAFEHNALDYLVKPVDKKRFEKTIARIRSKSAEEKSIVIRADYRFHKINLDNIQYIKSSGDYLSLTTKFNSYTFYGTLKRFLTKLPEENFRQCHRSYIININKLTGLERNQVTIDDVEIPISSSYKKEISSLFNQ